MPVCPGEVSISPRCHFVLYVIKHFFMIIFFEYLSAKLEYEYIDSSIGSGTSAELHVLGTELVDFESCYQGNILCSVSRDDPRSISKRNMVSAKSVNLYVLLPIEIPLIDPSVEMSHARSLITRANRVGNNRQP